MSKIKLTELKKFAHYQKQVFFSKTDIVKKQAAAEKDPEVINQICIREFKKNPSSALKCQERSSFNRVYKFSIDRKAYIIRISAQKFAKMQFTAEKLIYEILEKEKLQKVSVYKIGSIKKPAPSDYQIMDCVAGETLFDISKKKKIPASFLFELGNFTARLHKIPAVGFGQINMAKSLDGKLEGIYNDWNAYLECNLGKHLEYCLDNKIINKIIYDRIIKVFKNNRIDRVESVLLHGDLANHNVFINKEKVSGLIDWEDVIAGDPVFDIAFYGTGTIKNPQWLDEFLKGYKSFSKLPEDFLLRYWVYYLRISLSKAVLRHKSGNLDPEFLSGRIMKALSQL